MSGSTTSPPVVDGVTVLDFLEFSELAYDFAGGEATNGLGTATVPIPAGWSVMPNPQLNPNGLTAYAFINNATQQIVVAFRGTVTSHDSARGGCSGIALGLRPSMVRERGKLCKFS